MKERKIARTTEGRHVEDGDGVGLTRVLNHETVEDHDPFLMLDAFDSYDPKEYAGGFPMHPHRGIETLTYLISGKVDHEDSMGNMRRIGAGEAQFLRAGSGVLHQEMPRPDRRLLGVQLWLNLPKKEKMSEPAYYDIREEQIGEVETAEASLRVVSGSLGQVKGFGGKDARLTFYDIEVKAGKQLTLPVKKGDKAFVLMMEGDALVSGCPIRAKTAVLFEDEGECITLGAPPSHPARILFFSAPPIGEKVAWGGPIVMNTMQEVMHAFEEIVEGRFMKHKGRVQRHEGLPS